MSTTRPPVDQDRAAAPRRTRRSVLARVRAALRRSSGQVRTPRHLAVGSLEVDPDAAEARCDGARLTLSPAQLRLLASMVARTGHAFGRAELLDALEGSWADERTVDARVKNLRRRLGPCRERLETVRGVGYRMCP